MKSKRARGTGSLFKRPRSPFWWISFHQNGELIRESTGTELKTKAQALLTQRLQEVNTGMFVSDNSSLTVADLFELVKADYAVHHPRSLNTLLFSRWQPKRNPTNRTTLAGFFGHMKATKVTREMIKTYRDRRRAEIQAKYPIAAAQAKQRKHGEMVGYGTINKELDVLRKAYQLAVEERKLNERQVPNFMKLRLPENKRQGFVKDDSYKGLVNACTDVGGLWLRTCFEIGYTYGWRVDEIRNLKVENVDLTERQLVIYETKNNDGKVAPIRSELLLSLLKECCDGKGKNDFVFTKPNGQHVSYWSFRNCWLKVCRLTGHDGVLFHDLRRSALSNAVKRGVPKKVAMALSGHKTESVFHRYVIIETEDVAEAVDRIERKRAENLDKTHQTHTTTTTPTQPPSPSTTSNSIQ